MALYLQTSTANPYGHRPWATRLYTTFDDFAYLKQPQNTILREPAAMKPQIYKPPELAGLGAVVTGRRRRGMLGAMPAAIDSVFFRRPMPGPMPVRAFPLPIYATMPPVVPQTPAPTLPPAPFTPWTVLPPTLVPPVPTPVASGPAGTIFSLPGTVPDPGSPFDQTAAPAPPSAAPAASALADWFNAQTWVAGIPNGYVALGAAAALYFMAKKRGR